MDRFLERMDHFIYWPDPQDYEYIAYCFNNLTLPDFPGIIGCIGKAYKFPTFKHTAEIK